jgi:hypothetical protein
VTNPRGQLEDLGLHSHTKSQQKNYTIKDSVRRENSKEKPTAERPTGEKGREPRERWRAGLMDKGDEGLLCLFIRHITQPSNAPRYS